MRSSERSISTSSVTSEGRGRTNPPLLNEIISMLEEMNYPVNQQLLDKAETIKVSNSKFTVQFSTFDMRLFLFKLFIVVLYAAIRLSQNGGVFVAASGRGLIFNSLKLL